MISSTISTGVCLAFVVTLGIGVALAEAASPVRVDTISSRFAFDNFTFEINPQTGAAAIRLEYSYPPYRLSGDETYRDPGSRIVTLPGLTYDRSTHEVVYESGAMRTACAVETGHRGLLWTRPHLRNTGACVVTARISRHLEPDGWTVTQFDTLDTYFEVRGH
jgi:hypothetical protein